MDLVFIDTGAFIALFSRNDEHRKRATEVNADLLKRRVTRVTTNHVISESCSWMLRRDPAGHKRAVGFGQALLGDPTVRHVCLPDRIPSATGLVVVYTDPQIERIAWDIFARYDTAGFSFTDCVSFAVMQSLDIKKAFTFDKHYDMLGFERL
jgi:uncharacterized protein